MWTTLFLSLLAAPTDEVKIGRAFPEHPVWTRPIWFGPMDSSSDWHAMAEQDGRVHLFRVDKSGKASAPQLFLDISDDVSRRGNEEGLIGLAFHPEFKKNRRFIDSPVFLY